MSFLRLLGWLCGGGVVVVSGFFRIEILRVSIPIYVILGYRFFEFLECLFYLILFFCFS